MFGVSIAITAAVLYHHIKTRDSEVSSKPGNSSLGVHIQSDMEAAKAEPLYEVVKAGSRQPGMIGCCKAVDSLSGYEIETHFVTPWTKGTGEGVALNMNRDTPLEAGQEAPGALGLGDRAGPEVADTLGGDDGWTLAGPDVTI